jgi:hypothetical protein
LGDRLDQQDGAIAVMFAMLLTAMLGLAALAIDLGALRVDRRAAQTAADMAAAAGVLRLNPEFTDPTGAGGSPPRACREAIAYFVANSPGAAPPPGDPCAAWDAFSYETCTEATSTNLVTAESGDYEVTLAWPVHHGVAGADGYTWMEDEGYSEELDGRPCGRMGVRVSRTRGFLFGPVLDPGFAEGTTQARAVARVDQDGELGGVPALVVLDPNGCEVLDARGGGSDSGGIWVWEGQGGETGGITVDSTGRDCGSGQYVIRGITATNPEVKAGVTGVTVGGRGIVRNGEIRMFAIQNVTHAARAFDPGDVATSDSGGKLLGGWPKPGRPVGGRQFTRARVDHIYDCRTGYTGASYSRHPGLPDCAGVLLPDREVPAGSRYLTNLRTAVNGAASNPAAAGYTVRSGTQCTVGSNTTVTETLPEGSKGLWYDCSTLNVRGTLNIPRGDVVVTGGIDVGGGRLSINANTAQDNVVVLRSGDLSIGGANAEVTLGNRSADRGGTFVYLPGGVLEATGGQALTWIAPHRGEFQSLALWTESASLHRLTGGAGLDLDGVFYMPNATPFRFTGSGMMAQQRAQFITYRIELRGNGKLSMRPDPDRAVLEPRFGVGLIR